jgi:hypothetical protein
MKKLLSILLVGFAFVAISFTVEGSTESSMMREYCTETFVGMVGECRAYQVTCTVIDSNGGFTVVDGGYKVYCPCNGCTDPGPPPAQ